MKNGVFLEAEGAALPFFFLFSLSETFTVTCTCVMGFFKNIIANKFYLF